MTLRIDVNSLGDLTGHCYVHFAFVFTLRCKHVRQLYRKQTDVRYTGANIDAELVCITKLDFSPSSLGYTH